MALRQQACLNRQNIRSDYLSQATIIWRVGFIRSDNDELQCDSSNKVNYESCYSYRLTITTIKIFSHSATYAGAAFYNAMRHASPMLISLLTNKISELSRIL